MDIDPALDCICDGSSRLALWHNLREDDMINLVFRRPDDAPSERPTPAAPALNNTPKPRTTMRSFSFLLSTGSIIGLTRDLFDNRETELH